jgi:hypothetical protein
MVGTLEEGRMIGFTSDVGYRWNPPGRIHAWVLARRTRWTIAQGLQPVDIYSACWRSLRAGPSGMRLFRDK